MNTLLCHDLLAQQDREGLSDPARIRIVTLPDHSSGKHLECESGHKIHLSANGETWPCDCTRQIKLVANECHLLSITINLSAY